MVLRPVAELSIETDVQSVDDRLGERPAFGKTVVRRSGTDARLDGIELADPAQGFCCHGRRRGFGHIVELASRVTPACGERDVLLVSQLLEAGVAVDMQDALEGGKMCDRSLRLAIRSEQIDCGRRFGARLFANIESGVVARYGRKAALAKRPRRLQRKRRALALLDVRRHRESRLR